MSHDPTQARPEPWRQRLADLLAQRQAQPFAWGRHDCVLWAADCVAATTGRDHAAGWRGSYDDAAGAARLLRRLGGLAALGAMAGHEIAPMGAGLGDVGLVEHDSRELLAVCFGTVWLAPSAQGMAAMPLDAARNAWRVAHG